MNQRETDPSNLPGPDEPDDGDTPEDDDTEAAPA